MSRHWWVLVVLLVAFGVAGRIDYEGIVRDEQRAQSLTDKGKRV